MEEKYNLAEMLLIKERKQSLISKLYLVLNATSIKKTPQKKKKKKSLISKLYLVLNAATSINFTPLFLNLLISVLSPN